jgi:hypothetical protein
LPGALSLSFLSPHAVALQRVAAWDPMCIHLKRLHSGGGGPEQSQVASGLRRALLVPSPFGGVRCHWGVSVLEVGMAMRSSSSGVSSRALNCDDRPRYDANASRVILALGTAGVARAWLLLGAVSCGDPRVAPVAFRSWRLVEARMHNLRADARVMGAGDDTSPVSKPSRQRRMASPLGARWKGGGAPPPLANIYIYIYIYV